MSRGHVLDVKLRSGQLRATRTRLAAMAFGVLFGTVFGLYLFWRAGEWALDHFIYENPEFAIRQIDVQTDGVIMPDQLRRWAAVKPGDNLFALDLATVKRNLELVSMIESVSVERILPRTLRIRVNEREPVAQVNVPSADAAGKIQVNVFELDADGYVMQPLDPRLCVVPLAQVSDELPVIIGLNFFQLQPGRRMDSPQVQAALQLITDFNSSPMAGLVNLQRIDVSAPEVLVATTAQGSEITFDLDDFSRQLGRWREIYDVGQRMNKTIASLNLAVTNNISARWIDGGGVPISTPRPLKHAHTLKNNV
ncbi:MAG: FtsQ-type POTRA domain-containing protein [Verrucomicrobiia bacterium]